MKKDDIQKNNKGNGGFEEVVQALEQLVRLEFVSGRNLFADDFKNIIHRLKDNSFKLAVVGEFSSGKSTFLNALIGKDLLKHGAKETTATITELENRNGKTDVFDVYYESGKQETNIPISLLEEYTATSSTRHHVAQEIKKVVIKSNIIASDDKVCFVDTPGLNGTADNHREKTIEQIKNAHACIYLLQVRGLGQSDIEFIQFISKYQHNIIFIQNFIDELKELEGETVEGKLEAQRKLLEENVFLNQTEVSYKLLGISARKALIARDLQIKKYDDVVLNDEMREQLYKESQFETVRLTIMELMKENKKNSIQKKQTVAVALELLEQLSGIIDCQREKEETKWNDSIEGRTRKNLEQIRQTLVNSKNQYLGNIHNFVEAESDDIRKQINKKIENNLNENIDKIARNTIMGIKNIDDFDVFVRGNSISQYLYDCVSKLENECNDYANRNFENLLCNAVLRIKEYTGSQPGEKKVANFQADRYSVKTTDFTYKQEEREIQQLNIELAEKKTQLEINEEKKKQKQNDAEEYKADIERNKANIKWAEEEKKKRIADLGAEPELVRKYRTEQYHIYRGGFGIIDAIFGPKKGEREVPYWDESDKEKWKREKSEIEHRYRKKQDALEAESRMLTNKMEECNEDIASLAKLGPQKEKEIKRLEELIKAKKQYIEAERSKAQEEYLINQKRALMDGIKDYFDDVSDELSEYFKNFVMRNSQQVYQLAEKMFDVAYERRLSALSDMISENDVKNTAIKTEQQMAVIKNTVRILEEYRCQGN